jgi:hypothetical protein
MSQAYTAREKHCEQADCQANTGSQMSVLIVIASALSRRCDAIDELLR